MSNAASNADAFYKEVVLNKRVWTINDERGFPAPLNSDNIRSAPFWSSEKRALDVIENVPAYYGFKTVEISLDDFISKWIPGLRKDGHLIGLNWSGPTAKGFDTDPEIVGKALAHAIQRQSQE